MAYTSSYKRTLKIRVGLLCFLHWAVFLFLSIGYFTPMWLKVPWDSELKLSPLVSNDLANASCSSIGLVTSLCDDSVKRFINTDLKYNLGQVLNIAFILMTVAISTQYVITAMTVAAVTFNLQTNDVYVAFLSVAFAVIYPIIATLVLVASIYVEASFPDWVGYSAILCNVAGGLMALAYIALLCYEYMYIQNRRISENERRNQKSSGQTRIRNYGNDEDDSRVRKHNQTTAHPGSLHLQTTHLYANRDRQV